MSNRFFTWEPNEDNTVFICDWTSTTNPNYVFVVESIDTVSSAWRCSAYFIAADETSIPLLSYVPSMNNSASVMRTVEDWYFRSAISLAPYSLHNTENTPVAIADDKEEPTEEKKPAEPAKKPRKTTTRKTAAEKKEEAEAN